MRTYIKAYMSLNFGQIPPLTTELAALERLKNRCHHVISVDIDPIFFKLAGNKNMHNIMNEFDFRPDRTTDYGVSCPWASKKYSYRPYNGENGVSTFSLLFLIGSFWYFHVTRTSIKAWMSLNFLKWDLTLAHWTQVSDRCPLGYLFFNQFLSRQPRHQFSASMIFTITFLGTMEALVMSPAWCKGPSCLLDCHFYISKISLQKQKSIQIFLMPSVQRCWLLISWYPPCSHSSFKSCSHHMWEICSAGEFFFFFSEIIHICLT